MKKKFGGILQDRLLIGGILLIFQMVCMVLCISFLSVKWLLLSRVFEVLSITIVIWLSRKYDNPAYKIAWIIVILLFPLFGGIFYLFWGNTPFNRARAMHRIEKLNPDYSGKLFHPATRRLAHVMPHYSRCARYIETINGSPAWGGSQGEYFASGEEQFASMQVELAKAKRFIFMEYFILEEGEMWNTLLAILADKVRSGVDVRVMYDDAGCISKLPLRYGDYLRSLGIQTVRFNKFIPTLNTYLNNRDHRKICIVDGNIGYMGGINLADEYINKNIRFGYWKDTAILVHGEAVANMTEMFLQLWEFSTGQYTSDHTAYLPTVSLPSTGFVQPFGDSPMDNFNVSETVYMQIINNAKRYVYITTPYLVLDNEMLTALTTAAQSGVDVRIVTPGIPDKPVVYAVTRSFYQQLIRAGVKIYEYRPGFVHAKMVVSDDDVAVVGTINMDFRSFYLHFECGTVFYSGNIPLQVRADIEQCIECSREIDEEWIRRMPWPASIAASILRMFSPLL